MLWRKVKRGLSAGRVQSVTLRLVADREREIQAFKPEEFWKIEALLAKQSHNGTGAQFTAALRGVKGRKGAFKVSNAEEAGRIAADLDGADFVVDSIKKRQAHNRPAAAPFITSTLQQEAWRKLRFTARRTMSVAQPALRRAPARRRGFRRAHHVHEDGLDHGGSLGGPRGA